MPIATMQIYMFRFNLPDGVHLAGHRTTTPWQTDEDKQSIVDDIKRHLSQNPDAVLIEDSIKPVKSYDEIMDAAKQLKAENPERKLAHEMGLDTPNRLLTNPDVARAYAPPQDA
jgi:hypothetical protein